MGSVATGVLGLAVLMVMCAVGLGSVWQSVRRRRGHETVTPLQRAQIASTAREERREIDRAERERSRAGNTAQVDEQAVKRRDRWEWERANPPGSPGRRRENLMVAGSATAVLAMLIGALFLVGSLGCAEFFDDPGPSCPSGQEPIQDGPWGVSCQ